RTTRSRCMYEVRVMAPFVFTVIVKDDERAFLTRDGRFERLLGPGRFSAFDPARRLKAELVKVVRTEFPADRALLLAKTQPQVAEDNLAIVRAGANEVAIVSFDGEPKHLVLPNTTRAYWKAVTQVDVETIDASTDPRVAKRHLDRIDLARNPMVT